MCCLPNVMSKIANKIFIFLWCPLLWSFLFVIHVCNTYRCPPVYLLFVEGCLNNDLYESLGLLLPQSHIPLTAFDIIQKIQIHSLRIYLLILLLLLIFLVLSFP